MIAKATWFNRRKYTGWGLMPKSWQGVIYIIAVAGVIAFIQSIHLDESFKLILTGVWAVFVLIDFLLAMAAIKLDEREQKIEAISERNASWTMVTATAFVILYVATLGQELKGLDLMPVIISPILAGVVVKGISNFILERRGI